MNPPPGYLAKRRKSNVNIRRSNHAPVLHKPCRCPCLDSLRMGPVSSCDDVTQRSWGGRVDAKFMASASPAG